MASAERDPNPPDEFLETLHGLRAASALLSRLDLANRAGKTFDGKRDTYKVLGYPRELKAEDYREEYERNGVATRIVETFPKSTWRSGFDLVEDENPDETTPFEAAWKELDSRLKLTMFFRITDILAGLGEFSALLLGVRGDLTDPLPDRFSASDLLYVAPFSQEDVDITSIVTDPSDPRFGQVAEYTFTRIGAPRGQSTVVTELPSNQTKRVHWSRVIHVAEGLLDDKLYGKPRLRNVWNRLLDLDKVAGGGAEAFWLRIHPGYVASLDKDLEMSPEDIQTLKDQVEEFANQMRRTIGQRGVDFKVLGADPSDFGPNVDAIFDLLSASTGYPKRILMGSERGELASTQDKTNFDDRVSDRRDEFAEPVVIRQFVDRLIDHGALPEPSSDSPDARNGYRAVWPALDTLDETEKAGVAVKYALINKQQGDTVITNDEIRDRLDLPPSSEVDELIDRLADEGDASLASPEPGNNEDDLEDEVMAAEASALEEAGKLSTASRLMDLAARVIGRRSDRRKA